MSRDKLVLQVTLDKPYTLHLDDDLGIDRANINNELAGQPAQFAWYATLYEMARNKSNLLKQKIDEFAAKLDQSIRAANAAAGAKTTEGGISAMIASDETMSKLQKQFVDSKREEGLLYVAKEAFEQRKDMLISIASNMRQEWDTDLKISKDKVRERLSKTTGG